MKEHYEKVILGVFGLIAVVGIVLGVLKMGKVEEDFQVADERPGEAPAIADDDVVKVASTLSSPVALKSGRTTSGREVDLFTGVALFVKKGEEDVVDLADPATPPVHKEIPNSWWLENRIDPGFADSPQRDEDQDGFSNLEEFKEKTDAKDADSFPSLFAKVRLSELKKEQWLLKFTNFGAAGLNFRIAGLQGGKRVENRIGGGGAVPAGKTFYPNEPYKGRFEYVELFQKQVRGIPRDFAKVKDLKPGKAGRIYEIASNNKALETDYTAVLYLDTPTEKSKTFSVEEGMSFSLPFNEAADEKPFRVKEISEDGKTITLSWETNGEVKERKLQVP